MCTGVFLFYKSLLFVYFRERKKRTKETLVTKGTSLVQGEHMIEITDLHIPQLDMYVDKKEAQLLHYYEPEQGVFIAESPNVILRALEAGYEPLSILMEKRQVETKAKEVLERVRNIPIYVADLDVLTQITGFQLARGMLCAMRRKEMPEVATICEGKRRIAILEEVVNPTNVGAIFRSAAALGMEGILLTHGCADPLYRRACRVSMGCVFQIPWTYLPKDAWYDKTGDVLKQLGYKTVAMALKEDSYAIDDAKLLAENRLAVVLGTEGDGLAQTTIADCDYTVCIPMQHGVDSLNVAAASAVAFWELGKTL